MLCDHECEKCPAFENEAGQTVCKLMNAELAASKAKEDYYTNLRLYGKK